MKTVGVVLLFLLVRGTVRLVAQVPSTSPPNPVYDRLQHDEAVEAAQAEKREHKPCVDIMASPASEEDTAAFERILDALHSDLQIFLYVSHDPMLKKYGGAMSFRCEVNNHEVYDTYENWTIYDPDLIQGDAARDFVFAHEIAHHMNGDTWSEGHRSKQVELRADSDGAKYLLQLGWNKARLLHALDLLDLPQGPQVGYPTREERKAIIEAAAGPPPPLPPMSLQTTLLDPRPPSYEVNLDNLLKVNYTGPIRFQSVRTGAYVCAIGTPDPKIPSTNNFAFYDNCDLGPRGFFDLRVSPDRSGYWIQEEAKPCPDYAENCQYVLESVGGQLEFWNQNLAADLYGWENELGGQEVFSFEGSDQSDGIVRIMAHKGGYVFVDPKTAKLQSGGSLGQAAEFKVLFDPN